MTQQELERFRTEIEVARDMGDAAKVKAAELAFMRRLQECQVHTGQRVKRHGEQISEIRSELVTFRVDVKTEISALRNETKAENAAFREEIKEELAAFKKETKTEISALRNETKAEIAALRKESEAGDTALRNDINEVKIELRELKTQIVTFIRLFKWAVSALGVGGVATLVKVFAS